MYFIDEQLGWAVGGDHWGSWGGLINGVILKTVNGGQNWETLYNDTLVFWSHPDTLFTQVYRDVYFQDSYTGWIAGGTDRYSSYHRGIVSHSIDGGDSWNIQHYDTASCINKLHFVTSKIGFIVGSNGTINRTDNGGSSWIKQSTGVNNTLYTIFFVGPTHGWAGGTDGIILHTKNGGITWNHQITNTTNTIRSTYFENGLKGWIFTDAGDVLKTNNGGDEWHTFIAGNFAISDVYIDEEKNFWAVGNNSTENGGVVYLCLAGGTEWIPMEVGTTNTLNCISFHNKNNGWVGGEVGSILYTNNGGSVWLNESTDESKYHNILAYPNPFLHTVNFDIKTDRNGVFILSIYNLSGQRIYYRTGTSSPGKEHFQWNASNHPNGIYFYNLELNNKTIGGKIIKIN